MSIFEDYLKTETYIFLLLVLQKYLRETTVCFLIVISQASMLFSQLKADFIFDKSEGCGSLAVSFKDQSTSDIGSINEWVWDLGGVVSVLQNPGIVLTKPGEYTICLTIKSTSGASTKTCKDKIIKVYEIPQANFISSVASGCVPVNATFKDLSVSKNGGIVSWIWGVGGSSNLISTEDSTLIIKTTYTTEGNYPVTLSVTDRKGCKNTITKPSVVNVVSLIKPSLDMGLVSSCNLPWEVSYENLDVDSLTKYSWDFGNGTTFSGIKPPIVSYDMAKSYTVTLMMEKGPCKDTVRFENIVNTERVVDFEITSSALCAGQMLSLKDVSNFIADSVFWDFGDGTTSRERNPVIKYTKEGCYTIKLIRYSGQCIKDVTKPCVSILPEPKLNYSIENGFSCLLPAMVNFKANADFSGLFGWKVTGNSVDTIITGENSSITIHKYGLYTVDLLYTSNTGCKVAIENQKFELKPFDVTMPDKGPEGCIPYNVKLKDDVSTNLPIVKWQWQVGNPAIFTSTDPDPIFNMDQVGRWDVMLIAESNTGCLDTVFKNDYIWAGTKPNVDFTATPISGCIGDKRKFNFTSQEPVDFWSWTYGDNVFFSNDRNPEYAFPEIGNFDIQLSASFNGCRNIIKKDKYIHVSAPKSSFEVEYSCETPNTIGIQNLSLGADSLYWVVHLSATSRDTIRDSLLSSYTFPGRGIYLLSHYGENFASGCKHIATDSIFIVDLKASYTLDTIRGCAPLEVKVSSLIQDAAIIKYEDGQYDIINPDQQVVSIIFNEAGVILGPKLIVTDRHGCVDSFQYNVPVEVSSVKANILAPDVICAPDSALFKNISTIGYVPFAQRQWSFSVDNQSSTSDSVYFDIPKEGNYTVKFKISDIWGCTDSISKDIVGIPLIPAFSADTLSCTQKAVRLKVESNATYLERYIWDFGDGTTSEEKNPLHTYTNEGLYDVCAEFFDSRGCSKKKCEPKYVKIQNPIADFDGNPLTAPCPPLLTKLFNKSKNGNNFIWDFGDKSGFSYNNDPSHVYTIPGSFDVTMIAQMIPGCSDTLIKYKYVELKGPNANMQMVVTGNCTPLHLTVEAQSDKAYEYVWDFGDGKIEIVNGLRTKDTSQYTYTSPGNYIPKLLVSDDNGCSRTFTQDPVIVNQLKANITQSVDPLCGLPAKLDLINNTISTSTNVTYEWQITGIDTLIAYQKNPSFQLNTYGLYNLKLIAAVTNCIDSVSRDSFVEVAALPSLDFVFDENSHCQNVKVSATNKSSIQYGQISNWEWKTSTGVLSNQENPDLTFNMSGDFTVTVKAKTDKGCIDSLKKVISVRPNVLLQLPDDKTICIEDSLDIKINTQYIGAFSQKWNFHPTILCDTCATINVKPDSTTTYYITTLADNGCKNIDSIQITVANIRGPAINLSNDTIICKDDKGLISVLNYNGAYTYTWNENKKGLSCYKNCINISAEPDSSTYYDVIVSNSLGCTKSDSILVHVELEIPDFLSTQKTICENQTTTLTPTAGVNHRWNPDPDLSCISCANPVASPTKDKYYVVQLNSDAGCLYTDSIYVKLLSHTSIDAGLGKTICKGESLELQGNGVGKVLWTSSQKIENSHLLKATAIPDVSSYFKLTTQEDECVLNDSVFVEVIFRSSITAIGDTVCPGETAIVTAKGNGDKNIWFKDGNQINTSDTFRIVPDKTMFLSAIAFRGKCIPDTANVMVYVHPKIQYEIEKDEYRVFLNSSAQIEVKYNNSIPYTYAWTPSSGLSCSDCPAPILRNVETGGRYEVIVYDMNGCKITESIFVVLDAKCTRDGFYIPNIFTPYNRDGNNDLFRVFAEDAAEFISISIFDRWGEKVWTSKNLEDVWDGYYKGQELVRGVYTYVVTARCDNTNEVFNFGGDITIID